MYAILDIESTGGKYNEEGITEIAIYKHDGHEIVDQFISLVNPERKIQSFVVGLTGINNEMLRNAPKFYEIAKRIIEITEDCVIVAHNAKFDFRMLQLEFDRLGYQFERKSLCTIKLAELLLPDLKSYSLGKLVKALGIPITNRHRASGDALATVKLFELLLEKDQNKKIVSSLINTHKKTKKTKKLIRLSDNLPNKTGVYYFYNDEGEIIYIGKSKNIKKRVQQHFTNQSHKSRKIQEEVTSISFDLTGNELVALLKENHSIKSLKPKYNKALKKDIFNYGLYQFTDHKAYINFSIHKSTKQKDLITTFVNLQQAKKFMATQVEAFQLCPKLSGLEQTNGPCFSYGIKKCEGACIEKISAENYNRNASSFIKKFSLEKNSFIIVDRGKNPNEKSIIVVKKGELMGYAFTQLNHQKSFKILKELLTPLKSDRDAKHILQAYLRKKGKHVKIEPLE
ncbi:exonuclease domain-containing protein [Psychroflexus sp. ALD_RP9]|uniref:exonuclease domain-containing protein n=1 Tax=Psychroflexus sp. ALD_RP9 TaxID=2777186 RepID=UPI001A8D20B3|nr:exonuclease domain-containing protein [Psychroflexus sp. ALD_RP9]QSS96801.1 GIY-YIG nuclease family protein [Psychroflexus sp. ALD_RP9]